MREVLPFDQARRAEEPAFQRGVAAGRRGA